MSEEFESKLNQSIDRRCRSRPHKQEQNCEMKDLSSALLPLFNLHVGVWVIDFVWLVPVEGVVFFLLLLLRRLQVTSGPLALFFLSLGDLGSGDRLKTPRPAE